MHRTAYCNLPAKLAAAFCTLLLTAGLAHGNALFPRLEVISLAASDGIDHSTDPGGQLLFTLTALHLLATPGVVGRDLAPGVPVSLTASYDSILGNGFYFTNGALLIGEAGSPLLTATIDGIVLTSLGAGSGLGNFVADNLVFTGGSLARQLPASGNFEGFFGGATSDDFSQSFTASIVQAKLGVVVPEPLSLTLVGSAAAGLLLTRRLQR